MWFSIKYELMALKKDENFVCLLAIFVLFWIIF